ncbi:MAG: hypothetical protein IKP05_00340 [Alphaproteobacteria bacterium]|nr:hypothetical protein [Alphaproteobacteria bacterium]
MANKGPIDANATIKSTFKSVVKLISARLEYEKKKITEEEYEKRRNDLSELRGISENPKAFFTVKDKNDVYNVLGKFLDLSILSSYYSPANIQGTRLLDSLMLCASDYYQAPEWDTYTKNERLNQIISLNKMITLKNKSAFAAAIAWFKPATRFAVRKGEKGKSR